VLATIRGLASLRGSPVPLRIAAVETIVEIQDRESLPMLRSRFAAEPDIEIRRALARALGALADQEALDALIAAIREDRSPAPVRDAALEAVESIGGMKAVKALGELLIQSQEPGIGDRDATGGNDRSRAKSHTTKVPPRHPLPAPRLERLIAALGRSQDPAAVQPLLGSLQSPWPALRAAAVDALVAILQHRRDDPVRDQVVPVVRGLLADPAVVVKHRAIAAAAGLNDRAAIPALLAEAETIESRFEAGLALAALPDLRALPVYLRGLADKNPELRRTSADALADLRDQAAPELDRLARRGELAPAIVPELRAIYARLKPILSWRLLGPFPIAAGLEVAPDRPIDPKSVFEGAGGRRLTWRTAQAVDAHGQVDLGAIYSQDDDLAAYGSAEITSPADRSARLVVGSDDSMTVWLNGRRSTSSPSAAGSSPSRRGST
jgi:HEAT repeat protein